MSYDQRTCATRAHQLIPTLLTIFTAERKKKIYKNGRGRLQMPSSSLLMKLPCKVRLPVKSCQPHFLNCVLLAISERV